MSVSRKKTGDAGKGGAAQFTGDFALGTFAREDGKAYPAMVIWSASNIFLQSTGEGNGMWCISRKCLTDFVGFNKDDKCTGGPSEHCFREARQALAILGKDPNDKFALHDLVDVVVTYADELVKMPVAPKAIRKQLDNVPMWDVSATLKDSGKVINETSV